MSSRDRLYAAGLSLFSFVLCAIRYWFPPERYFDEIYYPRSAMEYLQWKPQFEWTHPPLTKLIIAFSMLLFGGTHGLGDTGFGWRFMNVVIGALTVYLLYVFVKRLTDSTGFAALAAVLLIFDGFHFTQSRIATPEITVAFFSLLILYAFWRYLDRASTGSAPLGEPQGDTRTYLLIAAAALLTGGIVGFGFAGALAHQMHGAPALLAAFVALSFYAIARVAVLGKPDALRELIILGVVCGLGAASKWNALFDVVLVLGFAAALTLFARSRPRLQLDAFVSIVLSLTIAIYLASYIPFFLMRQPVDFGNGHDLTGFMDLQSQMFTYHDVTVARYTPHPYSSKWWEWPLLYQPVVYYYQAQAAGIREIIALPNPLTWWMGLLSIPFLGYLAWARKSRALLLLFLAYFAQWLPWIASPRMLFEYHFFPNDAVILIADTLGLQWLYERYRCSEWVRDGIAVFLFATIALFVYFYPVLAGDAISSAQWSARMWFPHWVRGPG
jgi:dolichyl-phosphate-mannose-protein mannosyltransferase